MVDAILVEVPGDRFPYHLIDREDECERGRHPERHHLHAESEADRAHQLVAEFRTKQDTRPSDDAIALARTLAR